MTWKFTLHSANSIDYNAKQQIILTTRLINTCLPIKFATNSRIYSMWIISKAHIGHKLPMVVPVKCVNRILVATRWKHVDPSGFFKIVVLLQSLFQILFQFNSLVKCKQNTCSPKLHDPEMDNVIFCCHPNCPTSLKIQFDWTKNTATIKCYDFSWKKNSGHISVAVWLSHAYLLLLIGFSIIRKVYLFVWNFSNSYSTPIYNLII